jgi:hypothetical protein
MGEKRIAYRVSRKNLKEREHLEYLGVDWRIILKWMRGCGLDSSG